MDERSKKGLLLAVGCGALGCFGLLCALTAGGVAYFAFEKFEKKAASSPAPTLEARAGPGGAGLPEGYRWIEGARCSYAVPETWREVPVEPPAVSAYRASEPVADFYPNVNLVTEPFPGDALDYGRLNVEQLEVVAEVVRQEPGTVGGQPMLEVEAVWPGNQPPTQTLQRYLIHAGVGIVLTCSTAAGHLDQSRAQCLAILDSIRLR